MPAISFLPFLQSVPTGTRILIGTLVLGSLLSVLFHGLVSQQLNDDLLPLQEAEPWFVLSPGRSWKFPWTLLTSGFVETNPIEFIVSAAALFISCRYLERVWGPRELIRFCIITIVFSNVIAFGLSWILWFVLGAEDMIYGAPIQGQLALQTGFLVAFTQLIPEHQIQLLGKLKIRVKALPGIYLLLSNVFVIVIRQNPYILPQFGFFVAWVYLRFFKMSENGEFRGDRSETFAFQHWFPPPIRPYVAKLGNLVFSLATRFGVVQAWDESAASAGSYQMLPGPGASRAEAERRRALALKALDARVASGAAPATAPSSSSTAAPASAAPSSSMNASSSATEKTTKADESKPSVPTAFKEGGERARE